MNNKKQLIKETSHFKLLLAVDLDDPYEIFHNKNACNFYIVSKEYDTVETGVDSLPMALMYLHQAEMGYIESLQLFNNKEKGEENVVNVNPATTH